MEFDRGELVGRPRARRYNLALMSSLQERFNLHFAPQREFCGGLDKTIG